MEDQDVLAITIGKNIMRLRKMSNLTQLELAEKLNYSDKSISKWEQGNGIPDIRILIRLSEMFGVTLDDLVHDHEETGKPIMPRSAKKINRLITVLLSGGLCWLVAVVVFVLIGIFVPEAEYAWLTFIYAVPATSIVVLVFSCVWHWKWVRIISVSVLVWMVLTCIYLTGLAAGINLALVYLIGIPLQILALFFFVWRKGVWVRQ